MLVAGLLLTACDGGAPPDPDDGPTSTAAPEDEEDPRRDELVIWAGSLTPLEADFNPFSPAMLPNPIFEPLLAYNRVGDSDPVPMLATEAGFNAAGTELTVKIRQGVTWHDGEEFTAEDVVFSYEYAPARPAHLESARKVDEETVVLEFAAPQFTQEADILQRPIVPAHIWGELDVDDEDATESTNATDPVGTGPFLLERVTGSGYTMVANEDYWQEGKPALARLHYLAVEDPRTAEDLLRLGEVDWMGAAIPGADAITAAGTISMINTPQDPVVIYTCAGADLGCEGPQTDGAVRRALSLAIDRTAINDTAFIGHAGTLTPALTIPGRGDAWVAGDIPDHAPARADVAAAREVLEEAGYEPGPGGIYERDSIPLEMTILSVEGWSDYNEAGALIAEQVAPAGIRLTPAMIPWEEFARARDTGEFELIIGGVVGTRTPDPYSIYADWFGGRATTPVGESLLPGMWNFSRYADPEVDAAIRAAASTGDVGERRTAYGAIQERIAEDLPYIPLLGAPTMTFSNTVDFIGWPTEGDLYMFPPPWASPSAGVILANLRPID